MRKKNIKASASGKTYTALIGGLLPPKIGKNIMLRGMHIAAIIYRYFLSLVNFLRAMSMLLIIKSKAKGNSRIFPKDFATLAARSALSIPAFKAIIGFTISCICGTPPIVML